MWVRSSPCLALVHMRMIGCRVAQFQLLLISNSPLLLCSIFLYHAFSLFLLCNSDLLKVCPFCSRSHQTLFPPFTQLSDMTHCTSLFLTYLQCFTATVQPRLMPPDIWGKIIPLSELPLFFPLSLLMAECGCAQLTPCPEFPQSCPCSIHMV